MNQPGIEFSEAAATATWSLLQDAPAPPKISEAKLPRRSESPDFNRIRCPHCQWQPKPSHRWLCAPCGHPEYFAGGCWTSWNTFTTRGRCPTCNHQWRWTACLNCTQWARHEEWYPAAEWKPS